MTRPALSADPIAPLLLPPATDRAGLPVRYRTGELTAWTRQTGQSTVVVDGVTLTDLPVVPGEWMAYAKVGDRVALLATVDGSGLVTYMIGGLLVAAGDTRQYEQSTDDGRPVCRMFRTTTQSISNGGTGTAISWSTADLDSHGGWSAINPTRYTIQQAGVYRFDWGIPWETNATGTRYGYVRRNGSAAGIIQRVQGVSGNPTTMSGVHYEQAAAGDYYELMGTQGSGGSLNTAAVLSVPVTIPYLYITRVRGPVT